MIVVIHPWGVKASLDDLTLADASKLKAAQDRAERDPDFNAADVTAVTLWLAARAGGVEKSREDAYQLRAADFDIIAEPGEEEEEAVDPTPASYQDSPPSPTPTTPPQTG